MKNSKKIIFKVPEFPHFSETFIVAQIVLAIKLGYDVKILIRKQTDIHPDLCSSLISEYKLLDKIIIQDYKIPPNKILRLLQWFKILILNLKETNKIIKYYKENSKFSLTWLFEWYFYKQFNDVAIFHVQYGTNCNPLPILKKTGFKPSLIVTFHGHDAFFPLNGYISNIDYYNNLFKYADLITANTPYLGEKLKGIKCPIEKLELIPVSVDTEFFYPLKEKTVNQSNLKLITVGRLDKVKGQNFGIEVLNKLVQKGINASLTIIGEGAERENLEALIKKHQLENNVFLIGSKSREEIRHELWQHDIYLLTGQASTSGLRETQGLATLEAQACGLPAVVFDSGGVKYTVEDTISGFICNEFDTDAVVERITFFYNNSEEIIAMGENAVRFVNENYSHSIVGKKWELIYNNFCDEK